MNSHIFTNKIYQGRLTILSLLIVHLFILQNVNAQIANAPCNSNSPWVDSTYTNLTAQINDNVGSVIPLCIGGVTNIGNLIDDNLSNFTTINITGVGCNATIGVTDGTAADTYPAGTWAGFRIGTSGLLGVSVSSTVTVQTFNNGSPVESQLVVSNLLGLDSDLIFADGTANVGFVTTSPFDEVRITFQTLVGVLWSAQIYHAVITKYCVGPNPACNTMTALTQTEYPAFVSDAGTTGVTLGSVTNTQNVVDGNLNNFGSITLPLGILSSGFISVKDQLTDYVAGTFAGFEVSNSNILGVDLLQNTTITTYLNGTIRETKSANDLLLDVSLLSGSNRQTVGFVTTLSFDEIRYTINQVVGVDVGTTQVYCAVIKRYCAGPALECNTQTALTEPDFPATIDGGLTGISGVLCVGCSITNAGNVVDTSASNFGSINLTVGLAVNGSIAVKDVITTYPAGTFAGFDINNAVLVGVNVLNGITVQTYLDGVLVETSNAGTLVSVGSGLLTGSGRQIVGFVATQPFNTIRLTVSQGLALNLGTTEVYKAVLEQFCAGPDPLCNVVTSLVKPTYPVLINNVNTGIDGILCVGCAINNVANVINNDTEDFATIVLTAGVGVSGSISVKDGISDYDAGAFAGFEIENTSLLYVNLLNGITIRTYLGGTLQETKTGVNNILTVETSIFPDDGKKTVGFVTTLPFDEVRISVENIVGVNTGETKVFRSVIKNLCAVDLECDETYFLSEPTFPVIINSDQTGIFGVACVACSVNNSPNVISEVQTDFATITVVAGVLATGDISVQDPLSTYPAGSTAGFIIEDTNTLIQADLFSSINICTYLDGVEQECQTASNLIELSLLGIWINPGPSIYNVGFITSLPFDEVKISVGSLASVINVIRVYSAFVDTRGANDVGFDCCPTIAPTLSAEEVNANCPSNTFDLTSLETSTAPGTSTLVWFTNDAHSGLAYGTPTAAVEGTYYAFYYNANNDCYSPPSDTVIVNASYCDTDGDGDPDNTDPDPLNPCVYGPGQVLANATMLWRNSDCDGDGVTNFGEVGGIDGNPLTTGDNTDPLDACSLNLVQVTLVATSTGDCDGDGVTNANEINGLDRNPLTSGDNTDPLDPCDYNEADQVFANTTLAWRAIDCDGDGNPNGTDPNPLVATALNDVLNAPFGATSMVNVLANDDYLPGANTSLMAVGGTYVGAALLDPLTGVLSYVPANTEPGTIVTLIYQVCNLDTIPNVCSNATVTITVPPAGDTDGDGDPDNTDPDPLDPCVYGPGQVLANATMLWRNSDCDGDGVTNFGEVGGIDGNPLTTGDNTDPLDACSLNLVQVTLVATSTGDCDGDGVTNANEINGLDRDPLTSGDNTDPNDPCDYNEADQVFANTTLSWRAIDCDGDGNPNGTDPNPLVATALNDVLLAPFGTTSMVNVLANDDYLPGVNTSLTAVGGTYVGAALLDPLTGILSYVPAITEPGTIVTLIYQVCNLDTIPNVCSNATVTITVPPAGDTDGDGDPDNTDPDPLDPCVYGPGQVLANATMLWRNSDCDGDGVTNFGEVGGIDGDPLTTGDNTDPLDPCSLNLVQVTLVATSTGDCDGDGVTNANEINGLDRNPLTSGDNTDPLDPCDYNEADQVFANTTLAWRAIDCDGDGNPNGTDPNPLVATAVNDVLLAPFGATSMVNVLANDDYLPGANTSLTAVGGTYAGAALLDPLTGVLSYVPANTEPSTIVTLIYQVCNLDTIPNVCSNATVTITVPPAGDTDGDGDPDNTDPDPLDPCVYGPGQVLANATMLWRNSDCDGDGVTNFGEVGGIDGNPLTTGDNTDPLDPCSLNLVQVTLVATSTGDCDGDGVTNANEINGLDRNPLTSGDNTDPLDPCDYNEADQVFANTTLAWRAIDCDGDGNPNGTDPNPLVATAVNDVLNAPFGTTSIVNVLANDDYLPGANTSLMAVGGTYVGTALLDPLTGVLSYVPANTEPGTIVTLIYQVCNLDTIPNVCSNATVTITVPESCVEISTKVLLEGSYNSISGLMSTTLNNLRYLPGQDPVTFFGQETPEGQPYNVAPWNYNGTEGDGFDYNLTGTPNAGYPANTTDWVLVSLRTGVNSNTTVCTKAALVFSNGTVQIPSRFDCCDININETYYVVIEHRNHLIVMSHVKVPIVDGVISYDFTNQDSYKTLLGFGQKNVGGKWVMYAGNGQQVNSSSADTDINVNDKDLWLNQNGQNSSYFLNDLDLNGDVNVQDKNVWLLNNGKFSDVPRN